MKVIYSLMLSFLVFAITNCYGQYPAKYETLRNGQVVAKANFFQSSLMDKYDIPYLKLEIDITPNSRFLSGVCSYKMISRQPLDTFAIEFKDNMTLDSVFINEVSQPIFRSGDHIYVPFATPIPANTTFTSRFVYSGTIVNGLAYGIDANSGLIFAATVSESFQAREWFPAKQTLDYKFDSVDVWLTTPNSYKAGSNGLLKEVVPVAGGKSQYRWSTRYPINYYLVCIAAGNYIDYRNYAKPAAMNGDSILVQHYVSNSPGFLTSNQPYLDKTPAFIEKFSELYGLYPFAKEKYGHLHGIIGGGMEHQTMSTMSSFGLELIAHELAHQWFGDNVTCGTWQDIWLNESFATYSAYLMREKLSSFYTTSAAQDMANKHQNIMTQTGGSVYVPLASAFDEGRIFSSRLSYNKGAAVLHNLRFELQDDSLFFKVLKMYQIKFKDSFAVTTDFKAVLEQESGRDFTDFFNQWIYGEGYPTYNIGYYKWGTDSIVLNINQTTSSPAITPLFKGLMQYRITSASGDTTILLNQTSNTQTFKIPYNKIPTGIVVDPNNWVINKVGNVLPLKLVSFTGTINNKTAKLKWSTVKETQMSKYVVERSSDGVRFSSIGTVNAVNTSLPNDYVFQDSKPLEVGHYRLKMENIDGSFIYSNVITLKLNDHPIVLNYDASKSVLNIRVNNASPDKLAIVIFNADGRMQLQKEKVLALGNNEIVLNLSNLSEGIFVVSVSTQNEKKSIKIRR